MDKKNQKVITIKCFLSSLKLKKELTLYVKDIVKCVSLVSCQASLVGNLVVNKLLSENKAFVLSILKNSKLSSVAIEKLYNSINDNYKARTNNSSKNVSSKEISILKQWNETVFEISCEYKHLFNQSCFMSSDGKKLKNISSFIKSDRSQMQVCLKNLVIFNLRKKVFDYFDYIINYEDAVKFKSKNGLKNKLWKLLEGTASYDDLTFEQGFFLNRFNKEINKEKLSLNTVNIKINWTDYFPILYRINSIITSKKLSLWPISNPKPRHVKIDKESLKKIYLTYTDNSLNQKKINDLLRKEKSDDKDINKELKEKKKDNSNNFFIETFKGMLQHNRMKKELIRGSEIAIISTNGFDASVVFKRGDVNFGIYRKKNELSEEEKKEKHIKLFKSLNIDANERKKRKIKHQQEDKDNFLPKHNLPLNEYSKIIGIDPGKKIIVTGFDNNGNFLREINECFNKKINVTKKKKSLEERISQAGDKIKVEGEIKTSDIYSIRQYVYSVLTKLEDIFKFYSHYKQISLKFINYLSRNSRVTKLVKHMVGWKHERKKEYSHSLLEKNVLVGFGDGDVGFINKAKKQMSACVGLVKKCLDSINLKNFNIEVQDINEFRTSKVCSICHNYDDNKFKERFFQCNNCHNEMNRDENAARNIYFCTIKQRPLVLRRTNVLNI